MVVVASTAAVESRVELSETVEDLTATEAQKVVVEKVVELVADWVAAVAEMEAVGDLVALEEEAML